MWVLTILLFIFILGIIILVHEFGHFIWAKKFGVHIYEFSIGMGPILFTHKGKKDKIDYNIRAIPIGGFVAMAGEVYDDDEKIAKKKLLCNKPWYQRLIIMVAGVTNNFILAIILLLISALIWGGITYKPVVKDVVEDYPFATAGIQKGDKITRINGHKVNSWDGAQIILYMKNKNPYYSFEIERDGKKETYEVIPKVEKNEETGEETKVYGVQIEVEETKNPWDCIKYAFNKFGSIVETMWLTISGLFTGKISLNALSGPVGIYKVVDDSVSLGIDYICYLIALLSINVGFINILPFPAFDGGHVLFLLIEKIKGSPVNQKIENTFHTIGFILLFILMIYITIQDIIRLF